METVTHTLLLPLMISLGLIVALVAPLGAARKLPAASLLGGLLATIVLLLLMQDPMMPAPEAIDAALLSLMLLISALAIAPLMDRARNLSLIIAAPVAGFATMAASTYMDASPAAVLLMGVASASLTGLIGSMLVPLHPLRFTATGEPRKSDAAPLITLAGHVLIALALGALLLSLAPGVGVLALTLGAATAALVSLITSGAEEGIAKAGEAAVAATLLLALCLAAPLGAAMIGVLAAFLVDRGAVITAAMRIDDPQHITGTFLLPALAGLMLPGVMDATAIASQLGLAGAALLSGAVLAALLWPLLMLAIGLAMPRARVLATATTP